MNNKDNKTATPIVERTIKASPLVEDQVNPTEKPIAQSRGAFSRASMTNAKADRLSNRKELVSQFLNIIDRPQLDIPESVRVRFREDEGCELRWVRYRDGKHGADDLGNINRKRRLHYTFVKIDEVPELAGGLRPVSHDSFGDLVTIDELALAKIPVEYADAYREALAEKVRKASEGILTDLNKTGVKQFIRAGEDF